MQIQGALGASLTLLGLALGCAPRAPSPGADAAIWVYRQITVWWQVCTFWEYWRGQTTWGQMERRGLSRA